MGRLIQISLIVSVMVMAAITVVDAGPYTGPIYRQGVNDIAIAGNYAYCATAEGLQIIDISNLSI